eukprot:GHUV01013006.1.p1 GENE.GHUV01013006.1~~GHUV01013006.1.p1  ORF type:complete len:293 (+),score=91.43 GHUV01013006.1:317-1195(+)
MTEPHPEGEHWVAQEGAFSAATSNVPVLHYYPVRGRAEPIRLTLAYVRQPWFEPPIAAIHPLVRQQLDSYPFRQLPRFVDEVNAKIDLVQSMAILRHLGRKYDLYGSGDFEDSAAIDMILDAVCDLRDKLKCVCVTEALSSAAVECYTASVLAPEQQLLASDQPGPGLACLERLLAGPPSTEPAAGAGMQGSSSSHYPEAAAGSAAGSSGDLLGGDDDRAAAAAGTVSSDDVDEGRVWFVGDKISIADIAVADLVDLNMVHFESTVKSNFPHLYMHRRRVMGQQGNEHSSDW